MFCLGLIITIMTGTAIPSSELPPVQGCEVSVERDAVYARAEGYWSHTAEDASRLPLLIKAAAGTKELELKMDIYTPVGDSLSLRPLLLMMHGGAYFFGNKNELGQSEWCRYFASQGYVAASIDYRIGFRLKKEEILMAEQRAEEDAMAALRYFLGREDLRIDPERIFAVGTSAGATTALSIAYKQSEIPIRAVGNLWGYVHDLSILEGASIPIISFQSERDPVVPYREGYPMNAKNLIDKVYGTAAIHSRAIELGIPSEHHPCPEKRHRLHLDNWGRLNSRYYEIRDCMEDFFREH